MEPKWRPGEPPKTTTFSRPEPPLLGPGPTFWNNPPHSPEFLDSWPCFNDFGSSDHSKRVHFRDQNLHYLSLHLLFGIIIHVRKISHDGWFRLNVFCWKNIQLEQYPKPSTSLLHLFSLMLLVLRQPSLNLPKTTTCSCFGPVIPGSGPVFYCFLG